jgi:carbon-monoxide dehydrogenase medium subunit
MIGDPQVRHRGTIGGSIAHGDAASDLPTVVVALDGEIVVHGQEGERTIPAGDFFQGFFETALGPRDVVTEIRVPKLGTSGWSYQKFTRRAQDWATVGVAAVTRRDDGTIAEAAIALTNMGPTPIRARAVEGALAGASVDSLAPAAELADEGTSPPSDTNATAEYRRHLARVLVRRAVEEALAR